MIKKIGISPARFWAMVVKEFIQMRRDRVTFAIMVGIPIIQLTLFGFAINTDPRHLPAAMIINDNGSMGRTVLSALRNSSYLEFVRQVKTETEGRQLLERGDVNFVINIPENFTRDLLRGDRPSILIEADATDPIAVGNALGAMSPLLNSALQNDIKGPLSFLAGAAGPIDLRVHSLYNPEAITQYNIVPGLMGVVLQMTMVIVTALAITREIESGTMENLLSMPTRPIEVLVGKIVPYILVGYIQVVLILSASYFLFHVPIVGSLFCFSQLRSSLLLQTWLWASPFPHWHKISDRPCRCRFSFCRRCCFRGLCSPSGACLSGHRHSGNCSHSRIS